MQHGRYQREGIAPLQLTGGGRTGGGEYMITCNPSSRLVAGMMHSIHVI